MLMKTQVEHSSIQVAHKSALNAFVNSLRVEGDFFCVSETSPAIATLTGCSHALVHQDLAVPVTAHFATGHYDLHGQTFRADQPLPLADFIALVSERYQLLHGLEGAKRDAFLKRTANSVAITEMLLVERAHDFKTYYLENKKIDFITGEQLLAFGHPVHPYPKCREGFSVPDLKRYAPEFKGTFPLVWLSVDREVVTQHHANEESRRFLRSLFAQELGLELTPGHCPYPMHPWQWERLKKSPTVQSYLQQKKIIEIEQSPALRWSATTSVRTLHSYHASMMLKFSMDVRLTNSVRHLQPDEVVRGIQVLDVLKTRSAQNFLKEFPNFTVLFEPGFQGIHDENGKIIPATIVTWRDNPFTDPTKTEFVCLATLTQKNPLGANSNLISQRIGTSVMAVNLWFERFLEVTIKPLILAQAKYGLYFGAHQQNIVLKLDAEGAPIHTYFRDCQGTGYEATAYAKFVQECGTLEKRNGNDLPAELGNTLISYYIIINSTFSVITALAQNNLVLESALIAMLKRFLQQLIGREDIVDDSFLRYLLQSKTLKQKGNFTCCLSDLNENTASDPFVIYRPVPNPLWEQA